MRILTLTWNLGGKTPQGRDVENLLHKQDIHHDIYVVGTQEALGGIVGSMFKPSKQAMNDMLQECLGPEYTMISSVCLQATHMAIYVSKRLSLLVSDI